MRSVISVIVTCMPRVHRQPAQRGLGGGQPEALFAKARHRAVIEQLALVVAPAV